jgi:hypothetical protein
MVKPHAPQRIRSDFKLLRHRDSALNVSKELVPCRTVPWKGAVRLNHTTLHGLTTPLARESANGPASLESELFDWDLNNRDRLST